jgi:hypothetical protein
MSNGKDVEREREPRSDDGELRVDELDCVSGGLVFTFKLVAVKTVGF